MAAATADKLAAGTLRVDLETAIPFAVFADGTSARSR
jgi:hypothetical protein